MEPLRWYVVQTRSAAEWQTARELLAQGIETFYPIQVANGRRGRWVQGVVRPQFPGYLFIGLDHDATIEPIRRLNGVRDFLRAGGTLVVMGSRQLQRCKEACDMRYRDSFPSRTESLHLKPGDWVVVPSGAFKGVPVEIAAIDKRGRISAFLGGLELTFSLNAVQKSVPQSA